MIIREALEKEHSLASATAVASYACSSPGRFKELMQCFMSGDYRLAQRAAWSVAWAARKKPNMITPYIQDLVAQLARKDVHDAVIRNSLRILEWLDIPESLHGDVMGSCFLFIETPSTPAAIKAFSLTVLFNLSRNYPDIRHELKLIIRERWDTETAAFRSRGKKILSNL